uniref:Uncharacterized protein n=1 Tax=Glossina palpalis gambiensis TaxID=67801 RepID=A0A1B0ATI2_9MUSC
MLTDDDGDDYDCVLLSKMADLRKHYRPNYFHCLSLAKNLVVAVNSNVWEDVSRVNVDGPDLLMAAWVSRKCTLPSSLERIDILVGMDSFNRVLGTVMELEAPTVNVEENVSRTRYRKVIFAKMPRIAVAPKRLYMESLKGVGPKSTYISVICHHHKPLTIIMHITHVRLRNSVRATKTKRKASHLSIIYINNNDDDSNNNREGRQSFGLSLAFTFYPSVRLRQASKQPCGRIYIKLHKFLLYRANHHFALLHTAYTVRTIVQSIWQLNVKDLTEIIEKHFERSLPEESTSLSIIRIMSN